jgi:hypothetical protein
MEHVTCRKHVSAQATFYCEECGFTCVECTQNEKHSSIAVKELSCLFPDICNLIGIKNRHATLNSVKINMIACINQLQSIIRQSEVKIKEKICDGIANEHMKINTMKLIRNIHASTSSIMPQIPGNEMEIVHKLKKAIKDWEAINSKLSNCPKLDAMPTEAKSDLTNKNLDALISQISSSKEKLGIDLERSIRKGNRFYSNDRNRKGNTEQ